MRSAIGRESVIFIASSYSGLAGTIVRAPGDWASARTALENTIAASMLPSHTTLGN